MSIKQLLNKFNKVSGKRVLMLLITLGMVPCAFADPQILAGIGDVIKDNFSSGAIIWGLFVLADIVISIGAYVATKKVSVFWSTPIVLIVVKLIGSLVITKFFGG